MLATRLKNGEDLKKGIIDFVLQKNLTAASVVSAVGSLSKLRMRVAGAQPNKKEIKEFKASFEIVSVIGTVDSLGKAHLHISAADEDGRVLGGHLEQGCIINTTAEITLVSDENLLFKRKLDDLTGFEELEVKEF